MKTYWDLGELERGALSAEEVRRYVDAELMLRGVLKVRPLELDPVPETPKPTKVAYVLRAGMARYATIDVAFETLEQARAFLALKPLRLSSEYLGHESVQYVEGVSDFEIVEVTLFTEAEKDAFKVDLRKAGAVKAENERRERAHAEALAKQEEALRGLWEDWHECRAKVARLREIADTFAEYKRIAGDDIVAARFLEKAYPFDEIVDAATYHGFREAVELASRQSPSAAE